LLPDKSTRQVQLQQQPSPDLLTANATGLSSGAYRLRWQVLASDGHITRGEVPFNVK
jgi:methionine-rich copper-binding protein CopC